MVKSKSSTVIRRETQRNGALSARNTNSTRSLRPATPIDKPKMERKRFSNVSSGTKSAKTDRSKSPAPKSLTLRQLQDLIFEIYQAKSKYDTKCMQNKLARETMEEFMYTFLNQRYGLSSLTITWAASLINGIRTFSKQDFEVLQFGKILRGQISEFHRFSSFALKEQVAICLRQALNERYSHKTEIFITDLLAKIFNGAHPLEGWLHQRLLEKLEVSLS